MPTTITSLVLFAIIVIPGVAYVAIRNRNQPRIRRTTFREIAEVAVASLGLGTIVILAAWRFSSIEPGVALDVRELIADPQGYMSDHYTRVGLWLLTFVGAATILAWPAAVLAGKLFPYSAARMSSWNLLFKRFPKEEQLSWVEVELDSDEWVEGVLSASNNHTEDTPDRDLVLVRPLFTRSRDSTESAPCKDHAICVSARNIRKMHIYYFYPEPEAMGNGPESEPFGDGS